MKSPTGKGEEGSSRRGAGILESLGRLVSGRKRITEEEIQEIMDASEEEGLINEEENEMIRAIFSLRDTVVREIMVPRTDITCIPVDVSVGEALAAIIDCGHSRIPVYEGTVDNIVGLLYAKDLLRFWRQDDGAIHLRRIIRSPYFIPESKNLEELLQEFRRKRVHIAIVIDEYGGTSGLVTIEDLLEQIVGDIQDEYDREEEWLVEQEDGSALVDARLSIDELAQHFGVEVEREKFDTVGGLIAHLTGKIPAAGEEIDCAGLRLRVLDADGRRIGKLLVTRQPEERQDPEE
jgi:CBS domain containing-hemolysin-like protein